MMETVLGKIPTSMAAEANENARKYFMHRSSFPTAIVTGCHTLTTLQHSRMCLCIRRLGLGVSGDLAITLH